VSGGRPLARALALALPLGIALAAPARAADPEPAAPEPSGSPKDLGEINKQLTNPVSNLWSITFQQNNFVLDPGYGGHDDTWSPNLLFQPVLPIGISEDWNLTTRPVIPLFVSQPHPERNAPQHVDRSTTFGDVTLLQLVSPSPKLAGNWLLGAGPTWMFPSATSDFTGSGRWQVGPAALVGYLSEKWIAGALYQQWWSFGQNPDDRDPTSSMNLQPFVSFFLPNAWSIGYSGNILANWKIDRGPEITLPIGLQVAKVVKLGKLPVRFGLAAQWMPVQPDVYGQKWNVQLVVSPVLPKLVKGYLPDPSHMSFGLGG
jgi:hypothetical protein